jgi:transcriptional regulator with XRE-family HTH domain
MLGHSIESIARLVGVSHVTWRRVERGEGVYTPTMRKMEDYFGLAEGVVQGALTSDEEMTAFERQIQAISEGKIVEEPSAHLRNPNTDMPHVTTNVSALSSQSLDADFLTQLELPELRQLRDRVIVIIAERERTEAEKRLQFVVPQVAAAHKKLSELEDRFDVALANGEDRSVADTLQREADVARDLAATIEHVLFELPDRYHDQAVQEIEQLLGRAYRPVGLGRGLAALIPRRPATSDGT